MMIQRAMTIKTTQQSNNNLSCSLRCFSGSVFIWRGCLFDSIDEHLENMLEGKLRATQFLDAFRFTLHFKINSANHVRNNRHMSIT